MALRSAGNVLGAEAQLIGDLLDIEVAFEESDDEVPGCADDHGGQGHPQPESPMAQTMRKPTRKPYCRRDMLISLCALRRT